MKYLKMLGLAAVAAMALTAFAASTASATTLEIGGVKQNKAVHIQATLKAGTSAILKDEFGTTTDTCTKSEVTGETESPFTAELIGGAVSVLTFEECTHETKVDAKGRLSVTWTGNTTGNVISSGAEVTVKSTFFGATGLCKTGSGTKVGVLHGVASGHATVVIDGTIPCGILGNSKWEGEYTVTTPTGLGVVE
jgi:uncharacterized protein (DUF2141 family)